MKFKSNRKHFTTDFAKEGENNEFWNMKISKPIIYLKTNIIYAQHLCGVNPLEFEDFDTLGVLTMYPYYVSVTYCTFYIYQVNHWRGIQCHYSAACQAVCYLLHPVSVLAWFYHKNWTIYWITHSCKHNQHANQLKYVSIVNTNWK